MINSKAREFALLAFLAFVAPSIVFGQTVTGTISGTVKDSTGAVLPGSQVVLLNEDTGISRTIQSNAAGRYLASTLPLGNYRITVTQQGFQTEARTGIVLTVGREAVVDLALSVGVVTQTVEVAGEATAIETTNATVSGLVGGEQIRELPLNGRSLIDLTLLNPGVFYNRTYASDPSAGFGPRLSVNGSRSGANLYLLDGTVVNDSTSGTATVGGATLGVEAVREFRLLTHNFSAEYGRNSGAVVSVVTRSGTNQFHGSAYEFVRNNIFDARDFFNVGALPAFRRNQFGAAVGGPVRKDRIFFFANYEGLRQRQGLSYVTVPDANARKGFLPDPAKPGQFRQVSLNSQVIPYLNALNLWPLPNDRNFGDGTGRYIADRSLPQTEDYAMERMDFRLTDKDNLYWRYIFDPSDKLRGRPLPVFAFGDLATNHYVVLSETHIFSGTALNDFRFAFNRSFRGADAVTLVDYDHSLDFVPGQGFGIYSFTTTGGAGTGGLTQVGTGANIINHVLTNLFQTADTFSLIRGAHSLKFGIDIQRAQVNSDLISGTNGQFFFNSLEDFLLARPSMVTGSALPKFPTTRGMRNTLFGWFIQDDFHVTSKLTLNLGLRQEFWTNPSEVNGLSGNLHPITAPGPTIGPSANLARLNFAPRVGMAWDPTGSGKTSVRLGIGLYHDQVTRLPNSDSPFTSSFTVNNPTTFPRLPANPPASAKSEVTSQWPLATPTVIHYSLDVQRQLTSTFSARLGYVGSYSYNMTRLTQENIRIPQVQSDGRLFWAGNEPRYNPNYTNISQIRSDTVGNYNGMQATLQKTFGSGLMLGASYSYSKALSEADAVQNRIADNDGTFVSLDKDNAGADYGRSSYDQRYTFVLNGQYQMPWDRLLKVQSGVGKALLGGWAINGIWQYGSGLPLNIPLSFNNSRSGQTNSADRPNLLPGFSNNPTSGVTAGCGGVIPAGEKLGTPDRWFDPCAFGLPAAGFWGNLGRSTVDGPNYNQVNFTLQKNTRLKETMNLEFRAEFFNLFNHPSFGLPQIALFSSTRVHAGNEGVISSTTSSGRQIQLGMKFTF